jgi:hypothetical protein
MIDWHHPRVYERLCCFGLTLFTLGVASHNEANPPVAVAAIIVATLLVVRLRIELRIGQDEERASLERKLRHIDLINALAIVPAALGALAVMPSTAWGFRIEIFRSDDLVSSLLSLIYVCLLRTLPVQTKWIVIAVTNLGSHDGRAIWNSGRKRY